MASHVRSVRLLFHHFHAYFLNEHWSDLNWTRKFGFLGSRDPNLIFNFLPKCPFVAWMQVPLILSSWFLFAFQTFFCRFVCNMQRTYYPYLYKFSLKSQLVSFLQFTFSTCILALDTSKAILVASELSLFWKTLSSKFHFKFEIFILQTLNGLKKKREINFQPRHLQWFCNTEGLSEVGTKLFLEGTCKTPLGSYPRLRCLTIPKSKRLCAFRVYDDWRGQSLLVIKVKRGRGDNFLSEDFRKKACLFFAWLL